MSTIWRDAVPEDEEQLVKLWLRQQASNAEHSPGVVETAPVFFDLSREPGSLCYPYKFPLALLRVEERDGEVFSYVTGGLVMATTVVGGDQDTLKELGGELCRFAQWGKSIGLLSGWGLVPKRFAGALARALRHTPFRHWEKLQVIGAMFDEIGD